MIRGCLDRLAATTISADVHAMLGKTGEPGRDAVKTPVAAPPVTSLFKTPESDAKAEDAPAVGDAIEDSIETADLGQRLGLGALLGVKTKPDRNPSKISAGMPKFGSTLAWAMESSPAVLKSAEKDPDVERAAERDVSMTPVAAAKRTAEDEEFEKVDRAMEVADAVVREARESRPAIKRKKPKRSILRDINNIKAPSILENEGGKEATKKHKLPTVPEVDGSKPKIRKCETKEAKAPKVKSGKSKKAPPLIKGQTKMTAFFRL